jgi:hypothetical protein
MGISVKAEMPTEYNVLIMDEMEWQGAYALWHSISSILKILHSVSISVLIEILIETLYFCFTRNRISHCYFHANQNTVFQVSSNRI